MATMRDVAGLAGVSAKTVSRVFNDDPHVLPETRARVEAALHKLNYVPTSLATDFRAGRAPAVGIAVPSLADPFFATIVAAVDDEAKRHDMSTVVTSLGDAAEHEQGLVESLLRRQLSGLIIVPTSTNHRYLGKWLPTTPTVFVDRPPVALGTDFFIEDDIDGAAVATAHLVSRGHRRIAFLGDDVAITTTANRFNGYRRALDETGITFDQHLVAAQMHEVYRGTQAFERLVRDARPTAVFSSNARTSIMLMPAIKRSGLAFVGFGDFSMANMLTPSLSVIDQDPDRLGRLAAQRLFERMTHPNRRLRRRNVLPVRLVERESSRTNHPGLSGLTA